MAIQRFWALITEKSQIAGIRIDGQPISADTDCERRLFNECTESSFAFAQYLLRPLTLGDVTQQIESSRLALPMKSRGSVFHPFHGSRSVDNSERVNGVLDDPCESSKISLKHHL